MTENFLNFCETNLKALLTQVNYFCAFVKRKLSVFVYVYFIFSTNGSGTCDHQPIGKNTNLGLSDIICQN